MTLREHLRAAGSDLRRHGLRTLLTMLGIIFGVGAVVSMLSIGAGAQAQALEAIDSLGLRNIIVRDKELDQQERFTLRERSLGLALSDLEGIRRVATDVIAASARKEVRSDRVLSSGGRSEARVLGVGREHFELMGLRVGRGSLFDPDEEASFRRVAVLGDKAARELFSYRDPVGEAVKVGEVWFTVVGVLTPQAVSQESFEGVELESSDLSVFIPITTALKVFDRGVLDSELDEIVLQVEQGASIGSTAVLVSSILTGLHGGETDFTLVVPEELLAQSQRTRRIFNVVMVGIAGISLLVGGIGIMNIMLASVLERTREIGIRRAMGARQVDIRYQFLSEAVLISVLGGLIGVAMGFSIAWAVALYSNWTTVVTGFSVALSLGFAVVIGLVFGTYPAVNAAKLDPIEALRYE
ncbi:MAG: ABC transporter permease [Acidobacteriota bacterium]